MMLSKILVIMLVIMIVVMRGPRREIVLRRLAQADQHARIEPGLAGFEDRHRTRRFLLDDGPGREPWHLHRRDRPC